MFLPIIWVGPCKCKVRSPRCHQPAERCVQWLEEYGGDCLAQMQMWWIGESPRAAGSARLWRSHQWGSARVGVSESRGIHQPVHRPAEGRTCVCVGNGSPWAGEGRWEWLTRLARSSGGASQAMPGSTGCFHEWEKSHVWNDKQEVGMMRVTERDLSGGKDWRGSGRWGDCLEAAGGTRRLTLSLK